MNIRYLQYFVVLAEEQHYQRAAERLGIEQSPLSRAIKALEAELRVKLFHRTSKGTRITPVGAAFVDDARRILSAVDQGWRTLKNEDVFTEPLRISLADTTLGLANARLSAWLAQVREAFPQADLRLTEQSYNEALRDVRAGQADAAIVQGGLSNGADLVSAPLWHDPIVAVLPRAHELAELAVVGLEAFMRHPLIDCSPASEAASSSVVHERFARLGGELITGEYASTVLGMVALVAAGFGLGFAGQLQMQVLRHPDLVVRPFDDPELVFTTSLVYRNDGTGAGLAELLAWCGDAEQSLPV
ncbi:LysR family transcriptional regulator [Alcaligenes sp. NLF5-7]|uniref:LysR family transcriptional regulator n=1 Tax=Alcaligenes sp. NLF5-7 TaxID=2918755 RepID=UPI0020C2BA1F|nr:LysR family transcriptional regulator [Alcaligenes sp. NLF5-7]UTM01075.1 LysR family transcriptional regulator [Alcaligenes sp. NLF5-7]